MGLAYALTLALLFVLVFGDYGATWLEGVTRAGEITMARSDHDEFVRYYLANRFLPGLIIAFVAAALVIWALLRPEAASCAGTARWILLTLLGSASSYLAYRFALRIPATYYNATGFLVAVGLVAAVAPLPLRSRLVTDAAFGVLASGALAGALLWTVQMLAERPRIAASRASLAGAIHADYAAGRRLCADTAALAAIDSRDVARSLAVSIPIAAAPARPILSPATSTMRCSRRMRTKRQKSQSGFRIEQQRAR